MPAPELAAASNHHSEEFLHIAFPAFPSQRTLITFFSFPLFFKDNLSSLTLTPRGKVLGRRICVAALAHAQWFGFGRILGGGLVGWFAQGTPYTLLMDSSLPASLASAL